MASMPSTSAAASTPSYLFLRFDLVRSFWTKISWPSNEGVSIFCGLTFGCIGFYFADGSVDFHCFELLAAGPTCKHICDTLRALPCELYLGIHASEGHNCVRTEFSISSI